MSRTNEIITIIIFTRVCVVINVLSTMYVQVDVVITVLSSDAQPISSNC